jgi:hypothetical protein
MTVGPGAAKMSAMTFVERGNTLAAKLTAALADPVRRERNVVIILLAYVAVWTLYAVIAKGSQDVHYDMAEQLALSRELAFGHAKHPPLAAAIVGAWFTVFPVADWAYYLLAVSTGPTPSSTPRTPRWRVEGASTALSTAPAALRS